MINTHIARRAMDGKYFPPTISHTACAIALRASRTHHVPPNLSLPVFRMRGLRDKLGVSEPMQREYIFYTPFSCNSARFARVEMPIYEGLVHSLPQSEKTFYVPLFNSDNTDAHPDGFLSVVNRHSEQIFSNVVIDIGFEQIGRRALWPSFRRGTETRRYRRGSPARRGNLTFSGHAGCIICADRDAQREELVLIRTVSLKEDPNKG
jgi:hypothetical protein